MKMRAAPRSRDALLQGSAQARVWVLEDAESGASQPAIGIAERLGVPFRRLRLTWNWLAPLSALPRGGSLVGLVGQHRTLGSAAPPPLLLLSATRRSAAVGRWLKGRFGCRLVQCEAQAGALDLLPGKLLSGRPDYDLIVSDEAGGVAAGNELPVLGLPHRLSPSRLSQAGADWEDRLDHLPHPLIVLLVGGRAWGSDMEPARAHALGLRMARAVGALGGSVLASTSPHTGAEAADALTAGLGKVIHVLHRWDEPGESPYAASLASADAIVVAGDAPGMLTEACATTAPVYTALPELCGLAHRRLAARLQQTGQIRPFGGKLGRWPRERLDEAGRVAAEIRRRFVVE